MDTFNYFITKCSIILYKYIKNSVVVKYNQKYEKTAIFRLIDWQILAFISKKTKFFYIYHKNQS